MKISQLNIIHKEKAFNETKLTHKISYDYAFDIESI